MGIKDHIYMVVGCVNLLDLRIVASVILSVTVVNISQCFSIALKGENINSFLWPSRALDMWHYILQPHLPQLTLGPSHSGLSTCQVYSSLRAFALLFPLLRTFQQQMFK